MQPDRTAALQAFAQREASRRRAGQQPSTAGFPTGSANLNPQAQSGRQVMASRAGGGGGLQPQQPMNQEGMNQLQKSQPGEAELIIKAMSNRLRDLPPYKPTQNASQTA